MKQIINITDIVAYLFCPRKILLKKQGIREPLTKAMLLGSLRHKVLDIFNKNESVIVSSIQKKPSKQEIKEYYEQTLQQIINEVFERNSRMVEAYKINKFDFYQNLLAYLEKELQLRIESILKTIEQGFLGKELWRNLKPKYLTEFKIESAELGLRGRIDRVKLEELILPYEIKSRKEIFDSDKIQLAGYALLLEQEFGKQINSGIIETSSSSQEIIITPEMKAQVLEIAEKVRTMISAPILSNFKKCNSCSLNQDCLNFK